MSIQTSDFFIVDSSGTHYKTTANLFRDNTKTYDHLLVHRSGTDYKLERENRYTVKYTDYLVASRSNTDYIVSGEDYYSFMWRLNRTQISQGSLGSGALYGWSVASGKENIVVGARGYNGNRGRAYIYNLNGGGSIAIQSSGVQASDFFGNAVAIDDDFDYIYVSALLSGRTPRNLGAVYVFNKSGSQLKTIVSSDRQQDDEFGQFVSCGGGYLAVTADGDDDLASASGAVYMYQVTNNPSDTWTEIKITDSTGGFNQRFGWSQQISKADSKIAIGAYQKTIGGQSRNGAAFVYNLDGTGRIELPDPGPFQAFRNFGRAIAAGDGLVVVGALGEDSNRGAAYVFNINTGAYIGELNPGISLASGDRYGHSVAVGGGRIVVGSDNINSGQGAVFVFDYNLNRLSTTYGGSSDRYGTQCAIGYGGRIVVGSHTPSSNLGKAWYVN